jgi:hypothetical protein
MDSVPSIGTEEEGKPVYDAADNRVGLLIRVEGNDIYVEPDPDLTESAAAKLGWTFMLQGSEDAYAIDPRNITSVEDDRVVVRGV